MTALAAPTGPNQPTPNPATRLVAALSSEWTKLTSVRSTLWAVLATVVAAIGIGATVTSAQASRFDTRTALKRANFDPTHSSLSGILFAQLAIGVLAVLIISTEYSTGTIRPTLAAVPRRPYVLAAKTILLAAVAFVIGEAAAFTAFLIGQHILSGKTPTATLSDPTVLRAVISAGLYLTALALLALGLSATIKHTAAAISAFVAILFILPGIADVLPTSFSTDVHKFLPSDIGTVMLTANYHGTDPFGPWISFALLSAYAVALLTAGALTMIKRDA